MDCSDSPSCPVPYRPALGQDKDDSPSRFLSGERSDSEERTPRVQAQRPKPALITSDPDKEGGDRF
jgi:hypothetical protein